MVKQFLLFFIFCSPILESSSKKISRDDFDREGQINSQANFTPIKRLRSLSQTEIITPSTAEKINKNLNDLTATPGESQKIVAQEVAVWAFNKIAPEIIATPEKNQKLFDVYNKKEPIGSILASASKIVNKTKEFVATDINHVLSPRFERNSKNEIIAVHGGHTIENYPEESINSFCMLDQSQSAIGVFVGPNNIGKTVKKSITDREIIQNQKESKYIGKDGDLNIYQNKQKELFGVYISKEHSMIDASQFPLMSADLSKKKADNDHKVPLFSIGEYDKKSKNIKSIKTILASAHEVQKLKSKGKQICENVYSVRHHVEKIFEPDLKIAGFPDGKLPGNFYIQE